jgi:hypothetical protein
MKLSLISDDGLIIDTWYVPDEDYEQIVIRNEIEFLLPVYESREQYEEFVKEEN